MSKAYRPIACAVHDYVESACCLRLSVIIELIDGEAINGVAIDVITDASRVEWLTLEVGADIRTYRLDHIDVLEALEKRAPFGRVNFR